MHGAGSAGVLCCSVPWGATRSKPAAATAALHRTTNQLGHPAPARPPAACLHVRVTRAQLRQYRRQQVDAFAVHQPAQGHHSDGAGVAASGAVAAAAIVAAAGPAFRARAAAAASAASPPLPLRLPGLLLPLLLRGVGLKQRGVHSCGDGAQQGGDQSEHHPPRRRPQQPCARPCAPLAREQRAPATHTPSAPDAPFGMTDTRPGGLQARSTVFSLLVWLTQMAWCTSARVNLSTCRGRRAGGARGEGRPGCETGCLGVLGELAVAPGSLGPSGMTADQAPALSTRMGAAAGRQQEQRCGRPARY